MRVLIVCLLLSACASAPEQGKNPPFGISQVGAPVGLGVMGKHRIHKRIRTLPDCIDTQ